MTNRLRTWLGRDHVTLEGTILPPREMRPGGPAFSDDRYFLSSALAEADRLVSTLGLVKTTRVLDIGCGAGRLAIGILRQVGDIRMYHGVDVDERPVAWCQRYIERSHPSFRFALLDVENPRYNPSGRPLTSGFRFPFPGQSFDIVYLYSVFSHMLEKDVRLYLNEFRRLLASSGKMFFTAFAEKHVPNVSVNPDGYRREWSGPLHCVRYDMEFLRSLLSDAGFAVDRFDYATEIDGQTAFYASITLAPMA